MAYTVLALIRLVSMTHFNCKATPNNITDYGCHTKAIKLVNQSYEVHTMLHHATSYYYSDKINF